MDLQDFPGRARAAIESGLRAGLRPLVQGLRRLPVTPNQVTLAALGVSALAALVAGAGQLRLAAVLLLLGGVLDLLDGALARAAAQATAFGAFLDSTLDRVSEGLMFAAIAYLMALQGQPLFVAATVLALLGSLLVSYARARAEALGIECKVGAMTRAERVLLLAAGLWLNQLGIVMVVLAALTLFTVAQRVHHVRNALRPGD